MSKLSGFVSQGLREWGARQQEAEHPGSRRESGCGGTGDAGHRQCSAASLAETLLFV